MSPIAERTLRQIDTATADMTDEQLAWHPDGKWSAGDILEHLSLAFSGTVLGMRKRLESGRPTNRKSSLEQRLRSFILTRVGYFPPGRPAPEGVVPRGVAPREAFNSIRQNLIAMDKAVGDCEACFGSNVKIANHPVLGPLTAKEWRSFHYVHTRHHMRQIRALRQRMELR
jgi:hypothetical protein